MPESFLKHSSISECVAITINTETISWYPHR